MLAYEAIKFLSSRARRGGHLPAGGRPGPDGYNSAARIRRAGARGAPGAAAQGGGDRLSPDDLKQLVEAIALYPDPLLANVLAASVYPDEVAAAAALVNSGASADQISAQNWEAPVKAVAQVPEVIRMMGQYPDWTVALGQAYLLQAQDVMAAVQTLRRAAQENKTLQTNDQQQVTTDQSVVYIQPADPEVVYVPTYDPAVVYAPPSYGYAAGAISFGAGIAAGLIWANNLDCDWHDGCIGWGYHGGDVNFNRNINRGNINYGNRIGNEGNPWRPNRSRDLATNKPSQLPAFRGEGAAMNRPGARGGGVQRELPQPRGGAGNVPSARPGAGNLPAARPGGPGNVPTARPGPGNAPSARPGAGARGICPRRARRRQIRRPLGPRQITRVRSRWHLDSHLSAPSTAARIRKWPASAARPAANSPTAAAAGEAVAAAAAAAAGGAEAKAKPAAAR